MLDSNKGGCGVFAGNEEKKGSLNSLERIVSSAPNPAPVSDKCKLLKKVKLSDEPWAPYPEYLTLPRVRRRTSDSYLNLDY